MSAGGPRVALIHARAAGAVAHATGRPVLTTPDSAVRKLRRMLAA